MSRRSGLSPERMAIIEQGLVAERQLLARYGIKALAEQFGVSPSTILTWRVKVRAAMARKARGLR